MKKSNFIGIILFVIFVFILYYQFRRKNIELFDNHFDKYLTEVCLTKIEKKNKIPPVIYQTWITKDLKGNMKKCVEYNISKNPEINFQLSDNNDCEKFLKQHFKKEVVEAYQKLIPGAYKSDLWRYCILYKYGGIYMDIKYKFHDNVDVYSTFIEPNKEVFVEDVENSLHGIYNAFMGCYPGNQKLLYCINKIVEHVKHEYYGNSSLFPTGPMLLRSTFTDEEFMNLQYKLKYKEEKGGLYIGKKNKEKKDEIAVIYKNYREEQQEQSNIPYYDDLWKQHKIYHH